MIRADMDALPLEEATGLPYASRERSTTPDGKEVASCMPAGMTSTARCSLGLRTFSPVPGGMERDRGPGCTASEETVSGARE
jgi:hippurate hydrolase